jgi:hypothetical protein
MMNGKKNSHRESRMRTACGSGTLTGLLTLNWPLVLRLNSAQPLPGFSGRVGETTYPSTQSPSQHLCGYPHCIPGNAVSYQSIQGSGDQGGQGGGIRPSIVSAPSIDPAPGCLGDERRRILALLLRARQVQREILWGLFSPPARPWGASIAPHCATVINTAMRSDPPTCSSARAPWPSAPITRNTRGPCWCIPGEPVPGYWGEGGMEKGWDRKVLEREQSWREEWIEEKMRKEGGKRKKEKENKEVRKKK